MADADFKKITLDGLWKNNPALVQLLGLCPLLAVTSSVINGLGLGLALALRLLVSYITLAGLDAPRAGLPHLCQGATLRTAQRALVVLRTRGLLAMALTALPSDCLLACLARVPYADLRNGIPSTCKSLRDAATSPALRKTREAAGWTEWAVFAGRYAVRTDGFIITASGARRTVRRSHVYCEDALRASLSSDQDEVVLMECENGSVRACVFDPRQDSWRYISPLLLVQNVCVWIRLEGFL